MKFMANQFFPHDFVPRFSILLHHTYSISASCCCSRKLFSRCHTCFTPVHCYRFVVLFAFFIVSNRASGLVLSYPGSNIIVLNSAEENEPKLKSIKYKKSYFRLQLHMLIIDCWK